MLKFKALVSFAYENEMFNIGETHEADEKLVREWAKVDYVEVIEEKKKKGDK